MPYFRHFLRIIHLLHIALRTSDTVHKMLSSPNNPYLSNLNKPYEMKTVFLVLLNVFTLTTFAQTNKMSQGSGTNSTTTLPSSNPFSAPSKLPFEAPPFNKITDADYKPAIEAGIKAQQEEV